MYGRLGKTSSRVPSIPPFAAAIRKILQAAAAVVQGLSHLSGCGGIVLLNALHDAVEVLGGGGCPAQAHQGRKICFSLVPTSSCSTNSPRSAAARPRFTTSMNRVSSSR